MKPASGRPRVRLTLLVLLWFWAATMFLVVDLFFNVPEFDRARPRAQLYRAARMVAHEMVGEPVAEDSRVPVRLAARTTVRTRVVAEPTPSERFAFARPGSRHAGGRPDLRTPQGRKLFGQLREAAESGDDPAKRAGAKRSLERLFSGVEREPR